MESKGAYKATLTVSSDNLEDSPFLINIEYDPPLTSEEPTPTAYQFMTVLTERYLLPIIAFNERYMAEMENEGKEIFTEDVIKH